MQLRDFDRLIDRAIEHMGLDPGFYAGVKPWDVIEALADMGEDVEIFLREPHEALPVAYWNGKRFLRDSNGEEVLDSEVQHRPGYRPVAWTFSHYSLAGISDLEALVVER
ncbi:MAG: hypothetical protein QXE52_08110 [Candidatus Caldarchaeum sp.]